MLLRGVGGRGDESRLGARKPRQLQMSGLACLSELIRLSGLAVDLVMSGKRRFLVMDVEGGGCM
jgi:hypothetical protein